MAAARAGGRAASTAHGRGRPWRPPIWSSTPRPVGMGEPDPGDLPVDPSPLHGAVRSWPTSSTSRSSTPLLARGRRPGAATGGERPRACSCTRPPWPSSSWTGVPAPVAAMAAAVDAGAVSRPVQLTWSGRCRPDRGTRRRRCRQSAPFELDRCRWRAVHPFRGGHRGSAGHASKPLPFPTFCGCWPRTKKTGRLRLTGGRGSGSIWLDETADRRRRGQPRAPSRRRPRPSWSSSSCASRTVTSSSTPTTVDGPTAPSRSRSRAARAAPRRCSPSGSDIEAVVPSPAACVSLRAELAGGRGHPRAAPAGAMIVAVGGGAPSAASASASTPAELATVAAWSRSS